MSKEDSCQIDLCEDNTCSTGTCAPVSPFSREGALLLIFIAALLALLFLALFFSGYI